MTNSAKQARKKPDGSKVGDPNEVPKNSPKEARKKRGGNFAFRVIVGNLGTKIFANFAVFESTS